MPTNNSFAHRPRPARLIRTVALLALLLPLAGCGGGGSNSGVSTTSTTTTTPTGKLAVQAAIVSGYQAFQGGVNYPFVQVQNTLPNSSPLKNALRTALAAALQARTHAQPHDGTPVDALGLTATTTTSGSTETIDLSGDGSLTVTQVSPTVSTITPGTYTSYPVVFDISAALTSGPLPMNGSGTITLLDSSGAGEIKGSFVFPVSQVSVSADLTLDDGGNLGGTATITENGQTLTLTNLSGTFTGTITGTVTLLPQGDTGTATLSIVNDTFSVSLNTPSGTATGNVDSSGNLVIAFPDGTSETINNPLTASPTATETSLTTLTGTVAAGTSSAVSGDTVIFDDNQSLSAVTNSQGQFTLTVPTADITGHDTLTVFNSAGSPLQTQAITGSGPFTITLPVVPTQPGNLGSA